MCIVCSVLHGLVGVSAKTVFTFFAVVRPGCCQLSSIRAATLQGAGERAQWWREACDRRGCTGLQPARGRSAPGALHRNRKVKICLFPLGKREEEGCAAPNASRLEGFFLSAPNSQARFRTAVPASFGGRRCMQRAGSTLNDQPDRLALLRLTFWAHPPTRHLGAGLCATQQARGARYCPATAPAAGVARSTAAPGVVLRAG